MAKLDLSFLPDKKKRREDFSFLPDQATEELEPSDLSFLPDRTQKQQDVQNFAPDLSFLPDQTQKQDESAPDLSFLPDQQEAVPASFADRAKDVGISLFGGVPIDLVKGAIDVPEAIVGIADIPAGGRIGKFLQDVAGYDPERAKQIISEFYSEPQKQAFANVEQQSGIINKAAAALSNPSTIFHLVVESLPSMLAGGMLGRGARVLVPALTPTAAVAIGEGSFGAGQLAESIRSETPSGTLSPKQSAIAAGSGVLTGALSGLGAKIALKLGIENPDLLIMAGASSASAERGLVKAVIYGAVSEGIVEEMPQEVQSKIAQNLATGRPLDEGVDTALVMGLLAGTMTGAGSQFVGRALPKAKGETNVITGEESVQNKPSVPEQAQSTLLQGEGNGEPIGGARTAASDIAAQGQENPTPLAVLRQAEDQARILSQEQQPRAQDVSQLGEKEYATPNDMPQLGESGAKEIDSGSASIPLEIPKPDNRKALAAQREQDIQFENAISEAVSRAQTEHLQSSSDLTDVNSNLDQIRAARASGKFGSADYAKSLDEQRNNLIEFVKKNAPPDAVDSLVQKIKLADTAKSLQSKIPEIIKSSYASISDAIKPGIPIKKAIDMITGVTKQSGVVLAKDTQLLTSRIRAEMGAAKEGFKEGAAVTRDALVRQFQAGRQNVADAIAYVSEKLPIEERGKYIQAIQNATTPKRQFSLLERVNQRAETIAKNAEISQIKELAKTDQGLALDYQRKIKDTMQNIDLSRPTAQTVSRIKSLSDFLKNNGDKNQIPKRLLDSMGRLSKTPIKDMTLEQVSELRSNLEQLQKLGDLKQQLKMKYNERQRQIALKNLTESTNSVDPELSKNEKMDRTKFEAKKYYMDTLFTARVLDMLDGYKNYKGENARMLKDFLQKENLAEENYKNRIFDFVDAVKKIKEDWSQEEQLAMMFHLYKEQPGGHSRAQALIDHYGLKGEPILTPEMRTTMELARKVLDEKFSDIAAIVAEIENRDLEKIQNYFPMKYQKKLDYSSALIDDMKRYPTRETKHGFTFGRRENVKEVPRIDFFKIMDESLRDQERYIAMQPALDNASRLVLTDAYKEKAGQLGSAYWKNLLDVIARGGWSSTAKSNFILRQGRLNLVNSMMVYRLSTILMQPLAVLDAVSFATAKWGPLAGARVFDEFSKGWVNPKAAKEYINQSRALRLRGSNEMVVQEAIADAATHNKYYQKFVESGMGLIQKADVKTAAGVQRGIEKILIKQGVKNPREEAEFLMNVVSGSANYTMRPLVLSQGEFQRLMFTFQNFILNRWSMTAHDLIQGGIIKGSAKQKMNAILGLGIMLAGKYAEDQGRQFLQEAIVGRKFKNNQSVAMNAMLTIPAMIPYFGPLIESAYNPGRSDLPPIAKVFKDIFVGTRQAFGGNTVHSRRRGALKTATSASALFLGIPGTSQASDIVQGIFNRP